jgi:acetylornithine deacetylase/succinyl-diaminopimelate desuccinylase-like protein
MVDIGVFDGCEKFFSVDGLATTVGVGLNGGFTWTVEVFGKSVHSATSFLGVNPIEHGAGVIQELLRLKPEIESRRSALAVSPEVAERTGRTQLSPVLNVTIAHGGVKHNVVPSRFTIEGDRRFLPEEDEESAIAEIAEAIERVQQVDPDLACELTIKPFYPAFASDPGDPWIQDVCRLASAIRGYPVTAAGLNGSSDVAYVGGKTTMKVAINGIVRDTETNHHAPDERCRVDDLLAATKIVATLAARAAPQS